MDSNEADAESPVPRFLDDVEPVERKLLRIDSLGRQRWSLNDKTEDNKVLAEMGVALLDNNVRSPDIIADEVSRDDIENRSPNLRSPRCLKRSYVKIQNNNTPCKSPKFKHMEDVSAGLAAIGAARPARLNSNNLSDTNYLSDKDCDFLEEDSLSDAKYFKSDPVSGQKENDSSNSRFSVGGASSNLESLLSKENGFEDSASADCFRSEKDAAILAYMRGEGPKEHSVSEDERLTGEFHGTDGGIQRLIPSETGIPQGGGPEHGSPRATCAAHPALHRPPSSLRRQATFDDEAHGDYNDPECSSSRLSTSPQHKIESEITECSEYRRLSTVDQMIMQSSIDAEVTVLYQDGCENNYFERSQSESSPNVNREDFANDNEDEESLRSKLENEERKTEVPDTERECFVSLNRSFCTDTFRGTKVASESDWSQGLSVEESDGTFSKLSDEMVLSILQWLPKRILVRSLLVCRRWRRLGVDSRLWCRVDLGGRVLSAGSLQMLMARQPSVVRLASAQLLSPVVCDLTLQEWRVQFMDLSAAAVAPECLGAVLQRCPRLLRLSLEGLQLDARGSAALGCMERLCALNLALCSGAGADTCKAITRCHRLEHLNVAWTGLPSAALTQLCDELPPSLQRLNLSGCRRTLTNKMVETVVERCPGLVELDLSDAAMISEEVTALMPRLPRLEHLALSRCYRIQTINFNILKKCPSLQWLDAFGDPPFVSSEVLKKKLPQININKFLHSSIARPTVGNRRTSIWGLRTRD